MHRYGRTLTVLGWLAAAGLAACGGTTVSSTGGGGISGTGVVAARGTITQFGSVWVNGTEYFTDELTTFTVNGLAATEADLRIGMVVDLSATDDGTRATADTISYEGDLRGPVEAVNPNTGTITVLGQTVDASTARLDGHGALAEFAVGETVELSGHRDSGGGWKATYLQSNAPGPVRLEGRVYAHNPMGHTFLLGDQLVDYHAIAQGHGWMMDGLEVRLEGIWSGGVVTATTLEADEGVALPGEGDAFELEGLVSQLTGPDLFEVDNTPVDASSASFRGGTAADLALDVEVEVKGHIENGMFVAELVEFDGD